MRGRLRRTRLRLSVRGRLRLRVRPMCRLHLHLLPLVGRLPALLSTAALRDFIDANCHGRVRPPWTRPMAFVYSAAAELSVRVPIS